MDLGDDMTDTHSRADVPKEQMATTSDLSNLSDNDSLSDDEDVPIGPQTRSKGAVDNTGLNSIRFIKQMLT